LVWITASGFPKGKANLKPAHEPIVLARKPGPLRPLAIDECRIGYMSEADSADVAGKVSKNPTGHAGLYGVPGVATFNARGRWPSNVLLEDAELFDEPNPYVVGSGASSEGFSGGGVRKGGDRENWRLYGDGEHSPYHNDSGGYSRFFIIPKADRADREPVVRGTSAVYCNCKTVKPESWERQDQSPPEQTAITSPARAISEGTTKADSDTSTTLPGSSTSDPSQPDSRSTTSTATSSTTESPISRPSIPSPISGSTPVASSSTVSGGNGARSASSTESSPTSGGTSPRKAGRSTGDADPATSPESSKTRRCAACGREVKPSNGGPVEAGDGVAGARRNSHPT
jgi:hypothetical protein